MGFFMRNCITLLTSLVFLTACGGGGGSAVPASVPIGSISGVGFDGLLINANIKIYDFTSGSKGVLLGQGISDTSGLYNLSVQIESRPILIEAIGGYYLEEAGSGFQVKLTSKHRLTALANYSTGAAISVSTTNFTHLAAGLAAYEISKGASVVSAINDANGRVSGFIGVDVLSTTPRQINDPANASAALTPELRYGFLSGAISMWTYNHTPSGGLPHKIPYTSIDFAQLMYQDISADGLLDGKGLDAAGALAPLSFGVTPLSADVYRLGLGVALLQMAGDKNNKTLIDGAGVLPFVQFYISSTDSMFNNVVPAPINAPAVTVTTPALNAVLLGSVQVSATTNTVSNLKTVELLVDGVAVATATNLTTPSFTLNTTSFVDGPHTIAVRTTDIGGLVTTHSIPILIVNNVPAVTIIAPANYAVLNAITTVSATTQSTVGLSRVELLVDGVAVATATNRTTPTFSLNTASFVDGAHILVIRATDIGGQVVTSTRQIVIANIAPVVNITFPVSSALVRGSLTVTATAQSKSGLASAVLLVNGAIVTAAIDLGAASLQFPLNTQNLADGARNISVQTTDVGGLVTTHSIPVIINNIAPIVAVTAPSDFAVLRGVINVTATSQSLAGVAANDLLVDGLLVATAASLTSPTFSLNTAVYLDGAHTISVRSTDIGGLVTATTVPVIINNIAPVVSITNPVSNAIVGAAVSVTATTSSGAGLRKVELLFDGVSVATTTNYTTPTFQFNAASYADGAHTLAVRATDVGGLVTTKTVPVVFANVPPALTITSPAPNVFVRGVTSVVGTAQSLSGVTKAELLIDNVVIATATNLTTPTFSLNTALYADGAHTLGVRATDVGGLVTTSTVPVVFSNVPPVVTITSPAANAWVRKTVSVTANVASVVGVSKVELLVDNGVITTATNLTTPTISFDTTLRTDGAHTFGIRATNAGGLVTTANITVNIDNTPPTSTWLGACRLPNFIDPGCEQVVIKGIASDNLSGVASVTSLLDNQIAVVGTDGAWQILTLRVPDPIIRIQDVAGNCNDYTNLGTPVSCP